jgi:hypothetical protein
MMKRSQLTAEIVRQMMAARDDLETVRIHYCYQIGSTFVNLALMEDAIINAMSICDRIKVAGFLGPDAPAWERMLEKTDKLQSSTLGNLIAILSKHNVRPSDLDYLKWVKKKRDYFVHRFFCQGHWPGDLEEETLTILCRRLLYLEAIFSRASHRIWRIFGNAGLMAYVTLDQNGILMMQTEMFDDTER